MGDFTYTNSEGYVLGSDHYPSFDYTLSDGTDIDTATVTITIDDSAPKAIEDHNYIGLNEIGDSGTANISRVRGNVISLDGSSGDGADVLNDANITIAYVSYDGIDYVFDSTHTSYEIITSYGTLSIDNTGEYIYASHQGIAIPASEITDVFSYTIKDGDINNPETDTVDLTIHIYENVDDGGGRGARSTQEDDNIIEDGETIDTSFSSILADVNEANAVEDELILESIQSVNEEKNTETIVTNSLLKEGATLISDASPENVPQQIELDSTDQI